MPDRLKVGHGPLKPSILVRFQVRQQTKKSARKRDFCLLPEGSVETLPSWNRSPIEYFLQFPEVKNPIVGAEKVWRLDFAKESVSIEVAFNHGEAIAWNLLKPVLASEVNNVEKAIKTEVGVLITATKNLKIAGAFDNAVGEYEKVLRYLLPLSSLMSVPLLIIGLEAPEAFKLKAKYPNSPSDWGTVINL